MWIVDLIKELSPETFIPGPVPVYEDNESAIAHVRKQQMSMQTQHYRRRFAWISQAEDMGDIKLFPVPGVDQKADGLTKLLSKEPHQKHSGSMVCLVDGSSPFEHPSVFNLDESLMYEDIEFE